MGFLGANALSRNLSLTEGTQYTAPSRSKSIDRQRSTASDYSDDFDLLKEYQRIDEIYEKERERRQNRKEQEEQRHKHNYFPTIAGISPVAGDRYDSVYEDPFKLSSARPQSVSPATIGHGTGREQPAALVGSARAIYAFRAQNPR